MPQPTASDVHVSRPLTNISIAYSQSSDAYAHRKVFPSVPVEHQGDLYYLWDRDNWFRSDAQKRADATESAGGGFTLTTDSYFTEVYAFHKDVTDRQRRNSDEPINLDRAAVRYVTRQLELLKETVWATNFFATTIWSTDLTGGVNFTEWNLAASTPIDDILDQQLAVEELTGILPNTLVVTPRVLNALKNHPDILDRIKYTQRGQITLDLLASLFELDQIVVARGVQNTAPEGQPLAMSYMFNDDALLVYSNPSPSLEEPSGGYTFSWNMGVGGSTDGAVISQFRMEHLKSDRLEGECAFEMKVVAPDLGVFFSGAIT